MSSSVGTDDPTISDFLKAFIQLPDEVGGELVVGIVGEASFREVSALWESPFEQDTPGSFFAKTGALAQIATDATMRTTLNSTQVWGGTTPHNFTLMLELYAVTDPKREVLDAVAALEKAVAPELSHMLPVGRIPPTVAVNVGRKIIYPQCVVTSVSTPLDGPISYDGYPLQAQVSVFLQTIGTVNQSEIPNTFG